MATGELRAGSLILDGDLTLENFKTLSVETLVVRGKSAKAIGDTYIQLPGRPDPTALYTGVWENISSQFPGDFFRVEGGAALAFGGGEQLDQLQGWQSVVYNGATAYYGYTRLFNYLISGVSGTNHALLSWNRTTQGRADRVRAGNDGTNGTPRTGKETRSINRTIRVWERIS